MDSNDINQTTGAPAPSAAPEPVAEQPAGQASLIDVLHAKAAQCESLRATETNAYVERIYLGMRDGLNMAASIVSENFAAAPHSPVAQMSGDESHVLHVLRNPFGFDAAEIRSARLRGADLIERYRNAYANILEFAEANGLDTTARNQ